MARSKEPFRVAEQGGYGSRRCGFCLGTGYFPTEDGQTLLDFVQRHLLSEEDEDRCGC
jgi:hypothetical protein